MLKPGLILCQERILSWDFPGDGSVEDNVFQPCVQSSRSKVERKTATNCEALTLKQQGELLG